MAQGALQVGPGQPPTEVSTGAPCPRDAQLLLVLFDVDAQYLHWVAAAQCPSHAGAMAPVGPTLLAYKSPMPPSCEVHRYVYYLCAFPPTTRVNIPKRRRIPLEGWIKKQGGHVVDDTSMTPWVVRQAQCATRPEDQKATNAYGWSAMAPGRGAERRRVKEQCGGEACFLRPDKLGFPICSRHAPDIGCVPNCKGLLAAEMRAKSTCSRGYQENCRIAQQAVQRATNAQCVWAVRRGGHKRLRLR